MNNIQYKIVASAPETSIIELYKEAGWWHNSRHEEGHISTLIKNSFCFVIATDDQDAIIGMGRVISDGVSDAYIQDVYVKKSHRGKSIGSGIINTLKDFCISHNLEWIGLVSEPGTAPFYEKLGFTYKKDYTLMLLK